MNEQIIEVVREYAEQTISISNEQTEQTVTAEKESILVQNAILYEGPFEFTPTEEAQTIEMDGYRAEQNLTINPIPSNYGLITWNGSTLTVS